MSPPCKWQYVITDPTELPPLPLQLLFCGMGSWLTAGRPWTLALAKGWPFPSLGCRGLELFSGTAALFPSDTGHWLGDPPPSEVGE